LGLPATRITQAGKKLMLWNVDKVEFMMQLVGFINHFTKDARMLMLYPLKVLLFGANLISDAFHVSPSVCPIII
jgi:hypothetical protein